MQCREVVEDTSNPNRGYRCSRAAKRDGYCTQHHPDEVRRRRERNDAKSNDRRHQEWVQRQCYYGLHDFWCQVLITALFTYNAYYDPHGKTVAALNELKGV